MIFKTPRKAIAAWLALVAGQVAFAAEIIHQQPAEFLAENLPGCEQKALWLKSETKARIEKLLDRPYAGVRVRYCESGGKTAWMLDEIGKTEPITSGIVVTSPPRSASTSAPTAALCSGQSKTPVLSATLHRSIDCR